MKGLSIGAFMAVAKTALVTLMGLGGHGGVLPSLEPRSN